MVLEVTERGCVGKGEGVCISLRLGEGCLCVHIAVLRSGVGVYIAVLGSGGGGSIDVKHFFILGGVSISV